MLKPSFLRLFVLGCKNLFVLREPYFTEFDFIDLLIEDKAFFLITWKMKHGYKLKISEPRLTFYTRHGNAVTLLRKPNTSIVISISNLWRIRTVRLGLKHLQLDAQTAAFLLTQIREVKRNGEVVWNLPSQQISVIPRLIKLTAVSPSTTNGILNIEVPAPAFNKRIIIQSPKFNYQQ